MKVQKQLFPILFLVTFSMLFFGCAAPTASTSSHTELQPEVSEEVVRPTPTPRCVLERSAAALEPSSYISIEQVGTYNKSIITDELLNAPSTLPDATASDLPYWTGMIAGNKYLVNDIDDNWANTTGKGHFIEEQFKFIGERGTFNCMRVLYGMSYLGKDGEPYMIDESELDQLDEVISWGIKYNLHIMICVSGMPCKQNATMQEEAVQSNEELFADDAIFSVFSDYWVMLAKRYADIPSKYLSFELVAEAAVPEASVSLYEDRLAPVLRAIWEVSPQRIVIVNDVGKQIPEELAKMGACISLHNGIATVDGLKQFGINYKGHWPMEYLPGIFCPGADHSVLTLRSDSTFAAGTIRFYIDRTWSTGKGGLAIRADGVTIYPGDDEESEIIEATIPEGTKEIQIEGVHDVLYMYAMELLQPGRTDVLLAVHDLYTTNENEPMPTILIRADGSTENIDSPQLVLNGDYFETVLMGKAIACAKKYNVGFILSEVGSDTEDLSLPEYLAYHTEWLKTLQKNHISWMWNYMDNVCGVENRMWPEQIKIASTLLPIEGTPMFYNKEVFDMLETYSR